jgi:predicted TIM-barrel fold metal-dependent hydrolase
MTDHIIDCECHPLVASLSDLLPHMSSAWAHRFERSGFVLPSGSPHPGRDTEADEALAGSGPAALAAALTPAVAAAILVPSQVMPSAGWCDHAMSAEYAAAVNRHLAAEWLDADPRFRLAAAVAPHDPELAAAEIHRAAEDPRVVAISTSVLAINMGHHHYRPIFAAAQEHGLPVMIHPGGSEGVAIGPPTLGGVGPRSREERYTLLPQVAQANIASLVYDGVFTRFPELKTVWAGFGFEWAMPLLWRADMEWRNLRIDVPWVTDPPSQYVARHVRLVVDDIGAAPAEQVQGLAELVPEGVLLYGSDVPFGSADPETTLRGIPDDLREAVARGNAEETFGARLALQTEASA